MSGKTRIFPKSFQLYYNDGVDDVKFLIGRSKAQPLFAAALESDLLSRPRLTLIATHDKNNTTPLAVVKSKGRKDAEIVLPPPPPTSSSPQIREKLHTHHGRDARAYFFTAPVSVTGRAEQFMWRRKNPAPSSSRSMTNLERWELVRVDAGHEIVAVWVDSERSANTSKTASFKFLGTGASDALGPQWETMAVASVLRIWHEDFHVAKSVLDALSSVSR